MIFRRGFFASSGGGFEDDFLADGAHLSKDFFKFTVVGNGVLKEGCLLSREADSHGLGFDLARPSPVTWVVWGDAAVGQPAHAGKFVFESAITTLKFLAVGGF